MSQKLIQSLGYSLDEKEPNSVNKTFLANTIRDVEAHNRREQIDSCWRAHGLQKQLQSRKRRRGDAFLDANNESEQNSKIQNNEREKWALRKMEAFNSKEIKFDETQHHPGRGFESPLSDAGDSESSVTSSDDSSRAQKKKSHKKKSKKSKKKRKRDKKAHKEKKTRR